ncbi:MAG: ORF6N domain-containing protein [Bacteroidaceae bacterium]|nr:ORF6N domain-containing protein [Bacteroidaceae bacterium]
MSAKAYLAEAYGVDTSQLKRQVRRNIERFEGEDFMFEVTREELSRCQIGTLNIKRGQNIKLPCLIQHLM